MRFSKALKGRAAMRRVAAAEGVSYVEMQSEIRKVIDAAWESTDPAAKARQQMLFGDRKPTPEEFIELMANMVRRENAEVTGMHFPSA